MNLELEILQDILFNLTDKVWASPRYQSFNYLRVHGHEVDSHKTNKELIELMIDYIK